MKRQMKRKKAPEPLARRLMALAAASVAFCAVFFSAGPDALSSPTRSTVAEALLRWELGDFSGAFAAQMSESEEEEEGTTIVDGADESPEGGVGTASDEDNGVAARTLLPTSSSGYTVWKDVYIYNTTDYTIDMDSLMSSSRKATLSDDAPQVLIMHTHGSEAYTMPAGQEYEASGDCRTTDTEYNVVRVGDEMADAFENAGISVLHDRTLYDYPSYDGSYDRSMESIQRYLKKYPSIHFIIDVHRDAVSDSEGTVYKVVSEIDGKNAAQVSIIVGTDGSGLEHPDWRENLKLAAELQQDVCGKYPTLMRPMYVRNSRYNQNATTGSILVEVGAAGNSLDEALYSARLFAECAAEVFARGAA
ncbi:MAG: stage II sporulation protein P [Oscillospiraceae bacterium]|nr:stage II sporulation protein P [Oscillospiraceae bacterium]